MAVLLFMLAGSIMDEGGMARRIISFAGALLGQFRASLAMIAVGATMLISGVSGSGTADTAAVGSVMIPAMMKRGYERRFVTAIQAAAGALGPIIPPSIIMVVLGSVTNTSIGQLFIGGIIPGIIIGGFLMIVCYVHARRGGGVPLRHQPDPHRHGWAVRLAGGQPPDPHRRRAVPAGPLGELDRVHDPRERAPAPARDVHGVDRGHHHPDADPVSRRPELRD